MVDAPTGNAADTTGIDTFLQLFIEFMQLLSIFRLTRIGVVWRTAAEAVLLAMSIAPISSYGWVSFECLLRESLSPQQYALDSTLATTFIPGAPACQRLLPAHAGSSRSLFEHFLFWVQNCQPCPNTLSCSASPHALTHAVLLPAWCVVSPSRSGGCGVWCCAGLQRSSCQEAALLPQGLPCPGA